MKYLRFAGLLLVIIPLYLSTTSVVYSGVDHTNPSYEGLFWGLWFLGTFLIVLGCIFLSVEDNLSKERK
jgi:hypothetical protein